MGKTTIEWTSTQCPDGTYTPGYTHNLWWGCTKVSSGCKHCYAETWSKRSGEDYWGPTAPRRFFKDAHYRQPLAWNRAAERAGERHRVFCGSMMDLFEQHQDLAMAARMKFRRDELFCNIIPGTMNNLDWLLLTKRLENVLETVPPAWHQHWPSNVWLGFSASTQAEFLTGLAEMWNIVNELAVLPPVIFVSLEPLISEVHIFDTDTYARGLLDFVIVGGESGKGARPMHPDWVRRVRDDCEGAGAFYFLKQWGEWLPTDQYQFADIEIGYNDLSKDRMIAASKVSPGFLRVGKKRAGAILDGREWRQVPEVQHV